MQWDSLRFVLAVHTAGSVNGAGARLGVDPVTVARRIKAIEKQLGARLFDRTRQGHVATPAALEIVRQAEKIEEEIGALERRLWKRDKELSGTVRVTAPDTTGAFILAPLLPKLHAQHPGITIELNVDNRVLNISKRDADIAVRPTVRPPDNLIGHRLATVQYAPYAAKSVLPRSKKRRPDFSQLPWVGLDGSFSGNRVTTYRRFLESQLQSGRVLLTVNSALAMACAIKEGVGAGVLSCVTAARLGGLVRLGPVIDELAADLWILTHPELRDVARVATVYAFFREELRGIKGVFEGREG
jgi:DNA-binding transcriptional LysR family regulator